MGGKEGSRSHWPIKQRLGGWLEGQNNNWIEGVAFVGVGLHCWHLRVV
jgi:hypothetical protein